MDEAALVEIRNATVWRGSTRVFDNFSLRIEQHERVAIIGPNGAGKTTLLKMLNRELYPVARRGSKVSILGKDRWNVWALRRRIGIVSDDLARRYRASTTAREVVISGFYASIGLGGALAGQVSDDERRAAERVMHELGIFELRDTALDAMSSGQQRRCLLGRALVHEPDTLILDEPTAGLDLAAGFDYLGRIRRFAAAGRSIVLVTHHINEIPPEIGRVILLANGRVVADGDKMAVLTDEILSDTYDTPIRVGEFDGYFLARPGRAGDQQLPKT